MLKIDGTVVFKGRELTNLKNTLKQMDYHLIAKNHLTLFSLLSVLRISLMLTKSLIANEVAKSIFKNEQLTEYFKDYICNRTALLYKENSVYKSLQKTLYGISTVDRNVACGKYFIDILINSNIAIECDELGHIGYDKDEKLEREIFIKSKGYTLIRFNPDGDSSIFELINKILKQLYIK